MVVWRCAISGCLEVAAVPCGWFVRGVGAAQEVGESAAVLPDWDLANQSPPTTLPISALHGEPDNCGANGPLGRGCDRGAPFALVAMRAA